jgi:hypothetical protein
MYIADDVSKARNALFGVNIPTTVNLVGLIDAEVEGDIFLRNVSNRLLLEAT